MQWFLDNLAQNLMILGVVLLIIEVALLGFATFILLFVGLSLLITGFSMQFGFLDATVTTALWSNVVITCILAVGLWQPLKRLQANSDNKQVTSDFADDLVFILDEDVDNNGNSHYTYSGVQWRLKSEVPLAKGTSVKVVKKEVGVMWVAKH